MIWSIIYITAILIANYTAIWFVPLPIFGFVAVGTLVFGITFTARDYVHQMGRSYVYVMIAISALASMILSVTGSVDWRIIAASVLAILISESTDTEIYQRLLSRRWIIRVIGSNIVSIPLDTALFNSLAFAGVIAGPVLVSIMVGEIIVKFLVGVMVASWKFRI